MDCVLSYMQMVVLMDLDYKCKIINCYTIILR